MRWNRLRFRQRGGLKPVMAPDDVILVLGHARPVNCDWLAKYRQRGLDAPNAKATRTRPPRIDGKHILWLYQATVEVLVGKGERRGRYLQQDPYPLILKSCQGKLLN